MSSTDPAAVPLAAQSRVGTAQRDAIVLVVLITAVVLLIWNGNAFFHNVRIGGREFGPDVRLASAALTLNVALILFGWRRYVELRHEAEMRADGERRAAILASTDPITGLNNRKGFADHAERLLVAAARKGEEAVVISIQIQRFKQVNDHHGYDTGDELLRRIAAGLVEALGPDAVVARLSGDEFGAAVALPTESVRMALPLAEAALAAMTRPFTIEERVVQVGGFAGIARAPASEARAPYLLRRADIALNHAKNGRVTRPVWFDEGMERALIAQGEIEQGIRFGLEHGQFIPYFEPQVDLATGEIVSFEVLARWNHPLSGIVGADAFIPVAEEIGLIGRLSEQVITEALGQAASWSPAVRIAVNISPSQLADPLLAQRIVRILGETGFPADRLVVEITESSLLADVDLARAIVTSLKNQGVRLALDDFGTGFSSLSTVRSLPFDLIKIDRSFVTDSRDRENAAIIRAVTTLANGLSVPVCVEGIESEAVHRSVVALGCGIGQGWYFGKPMTAEAARELLEGGRRPERFDTAVGA